MVGKFSRGPDFFFSDLSDQPSQYATLKAIGYQNRYLVKVVLQRAVFCALLRFVPAWLLGCVAFYIMGAMALIPTSVSSSLIALSLGLAAGACIICAMLAAVRHIELFR